MVKKMIKKILIITLLFMISCTTRTAYGPDIHKGTEGLTLEFLENAPPDELWYIEDEPTEFLIGIGFKNKGTEDIRQGDVIVSSELEKIKIESTEAGIKREIPIIKGKSLTSIEGGFIPKYYAAEVIGAESGVPESLVDIEVKACYPYKTTASADICIDISNPQYIKTKKSCESNKINSYSGQGAPIAITNVREDIVPGIDINQLKLEIYFENKGSGKIINNKCKKSDIINLEEITFSDYSTKIEGEKQIECKDKDGKKIDDKIKVEKDKENKIICYAELSKEVNPHLAILIIKLNYWYSTSIIKKVKIKNPEYKEEIDVSEKEPEAYVPAIPKNTEDIKRIIKDKMNKNKPVGDFRNFRISKDFGFENIAKEQIKDVVNNKIKTKLKKDKAIKKILDCYYGKIIERESNYKQFKEEKDNLLLVASIKGSKAGCCVGIAQIYINEHLRLEGKIGDVNRAYEWITKPTKNLEKGVEIFLGDVKQADGDLDLAYSYYHGDPKKRYNVCSGKIEKDEEWW